VSNLTKFQWDNLATRALRSLLRQRLAIVHREAEAILSETDWIARNFHQADRRPEPHIITTAHRNLSDSGDLINCTTTLNRREVTVWADGTRLATRGHQTEINRAVARKRRVYRTYLGWALNKRLCGAVAEHVVSNAIASNPPFVISAGGNPGQFDRFPNGPSFPSSLDAGGYWPKQRGDPLSGLVQFAVEIKNTRSWVYPWSSELWQLLTSLSGYTDVIPVLVARRIHRCTFKLFKTVGALGWAAQRQWFSNPGDASRYRLTHQELRRVATALGFEDMTYVTLPPGPPNKQLVNWLSNVFYKREQNGDTEIVGPRSVRLWPKAAPIINRHKCLRDSALPHSQRRQEWNSFVADMEAAGFDSTDWATTEPVEPTN